MKVPAEPLRAACGAASVSEVLDGVRALAEQEAPQSGAGVPGAGLDLAVAAARAVAAEPDEVGFHIVAAERAREDVVQREAEGQRAERALAAAGVQATEQIGIPEPAQFGFIPIAFSRSRCISSPTSRISLICLYGIVSASHSQTSQSRIVRSSPVSGAGSSPQCAST